MILNIFLAIFYSIKIYLKFLFVDFEIFEIKNNESVFTAFTYKIKKL